MLLKPYRKNENEIFDPFHDFDMMERAMFGHPEFRNEAFIRTDIKEKENEYVLEAELPGFKKEDIDVEIEDGSEWTVVTADGSWSCHEEHTVAVFEDHNEILTDLDYNGNSCLK